MDWIHENELNGTGTKGTKNKNKIKQNIINNFNKNIKEIKKLKRKLSPPTKEFQHFCSYTPYSYL